MTVGSGHGHVGERGQLRASHADRDNAVVLLKKAFVEGRLTKDEYDARVEGALTARSYSDLDALVADLPAPPQAPPPPTTPRAARTNALAIASFICGAAQFFTGGVTAIPAVVLGHMARHQIRRTGEQGAGLALAGLIMGWGAIMLALLVTLAVAASLGPAHALHATIVGPPAG